MRKGLLLVPSVAGILLLSACAGQPASPPSTGTSSPSTSASPFPTDTPTAPPVDPDAPEGQCETANLAVDVQPGDAAAGSRYSTIVFTNTGTTECALRGYPGVSVTGHGNGTQLGAPADRTPIPDGGIVTVQLAPGGTAVAQLQEANIGDGGGPLAGDCEVEPGDGYRIYPPHSFDAVLVEDAVPACASGTVWMHVGVVTPGA